MKLHTQVLSINYSLQAHHIHIFNCKLQTSAVVNVHVTTRSVMPVGRLTLTLLVQRFQYSSVLYYF